jgi:hypothetical protein
MIPQRDTLLGDAAARLYRTIEPGRGTQEYAAMREMFGVIAATEDAHRVERKRAWDHGWWAASVCGGLLLLAVVVAVALLWPPFSASHAVGLALAWVLLGTVRLWLARTQIRRELDARPPEGDRS